MGVDKIERETIQLDQNHGGSIEVKKYNWFLGVIQWLRGEAIYLKGSGTFLSTKSILKHLNNDILPGPDDLKTYKFDKIYELQDLKMKCQHIFDQLHPSHSMEILKNKQEENEKRIAQEKAAQEKAAEEEQKLLEKKEELEALTSSYKTAHHNSTLGYLNQYALRYYKNLDERYKGSSNLDECSPLQKKIFHEFLTIQKHYLSKLTPEEMSTIHNALLTWDDIAKLFYDADPQFIRNEIIIRERIRKSLEIEAEMRFHKPFEAENSPWLKEKTERLTEIEKQNQLYRAQIEEKKGSIAKNKTLLTKDGGLLTQLDFKRSDLKVKKGELQEEESKFFSLEKGNIKKEIAQLQSQIQQLEKEINEKSTQNNLDEKAIKDFEYYILANDVEVEELKQVFKNLQMYQEGSKELSEVNKQLIPLITHNS